jgi:hypothetical protein
MLLEPTEVSNSDLRLLEEVKVVSQASPDSQVSQDSQASQDSQVNQDSQASQACQAKVWVDTVKPVSEPQVICKEVLDGDSQDSQAWVDMVMHGVTLKVASLQVKEVQVSVLKVVMEAKADSEVDGNSTY